MQYFPFFVALHNRQVLVVGGGMVAQRKVELLVRAGAKPRVVAPVVRASLAFLTDKSGGEVCRRAYRRADLKEAAVVVCATDDMELNQRVCADARRRRVLVNVVDCPSLCDFIFPAIVDRAPMIAAVSSCGASPVLARRLRAQLEALMPVRLGMLAEFCARFRETVKGALPPAARRLFWEEAVDGPMAEAVLAGNAAGGERWLQQRLQDGVAAAGEVYLIGAGAGDAELFTPQACRLLQKADVVVYDRLVSPTVLELARRDAEKIFVGKQRGAHTAKQEEINALLIARARAGKRVARLKGGDPFIFGRGGEELKALRTAGILVRVAAGVTAASSCAAAAGIPLTHRQLARGVHLCTAYQEEDDPRYWRRLADAGDETLVFYMAGATFAATAAHLLRYGRAASTPAAVICAGATAEQEVTVATLATIATAAGGRVRSPALMIVGEVVRLHDGNAAASAAVDGENWIDSAAVQSAPAWQHTYAFSKSAASG